MEVNNDGTVTYTPDENYHGDDTFSYTVEDNEGLTSNTATVNLIVNSINDAPIAVDDTVITDEDTPITINILDNDNDVDGSLNVDSIEIVSQPTQGNLEINEDGSITYTLG